VLVDLCVGYSNILLGAHPCSHTPDIRLIKRSLPLTHTHTRTPKHTYTHTHAITCTHSQTHTHTHTHTHTCTHEHPHKNKHTHTPESRLISEFVRMDGRGKVVLLQVE